MSGWCFHFHPSFHPCIFFSLYSFHGCSLHRPKKIVSSSLQSGGSSSGEAGKPETWKKENSFDSLRFAHVRLKNTKGRCFSAAADHNTARTRHTHTRRDDDVNPKITLKQGTYLVPARARHPRTHTHTTRDTPRLSLSHPFVHRALLRSLSPPPGRRLRFRS